MKNFLCAVFMVAAFAACKNGNGNFTITGKIKSAPSDTIYLEKLAYNSADSKVIDSAKLDKDGSYKLSGADTQQNLYVLSFRHNPAMIFINDAAKTNIDFDMSAFHFPEISGSEATKQLYSFIKDYWQKDSLLSDSYYQLDSLQKTGVQDSAYAMVLQQRYAKQLNSLADVIRRFIKTSNNPAAICFVLDKAKSAISADELVAMANDAAKRFPQHEGIASFKNAIAQAMKQQQETNGATATLLNQPAPDLTMTDINGKQVSISDFKGKYLLVDFWASWCGPCRQENPNVVAAYNKFKNKNFAILGVSLDEDKSSWEKAVKDDHLAWTQMSDLKQWNSEAISTYHFDGIPFNVLIDPSGKIIAEELRGEALEQKLSEVLQ